MKRLIVVASLILLVLCWMSSSSNSVLAAGRSGKRQQQQQQQQQAAPPPPPRQQEPPPAEELLSDPAIQRLNSIEDFQNLVMQTTLPCLVFLGNSKSTPHALRKNITLAANALAKHVVSFYFDTVMQAGREFISAAGLPKDIKDALLLFNPEFIKHDEQGGYSKNPAMYGGKTTPYGITRWFLAMVSRKHIDHIADVEDVAAFRKKFSQFSLPKVILFSGSNFTSPMFISVGHQFRYLSQFAVVNSVEKAAFDLALAEMDKEEREMRKVRELATPSSAEAKAEEEAAAAAALKKRLSEVSFRSFGDGGDDGGDGQQRSKNKSSKEELELIRKNHAALMKLFGVKDVPAIVTASPDLGDVEVHPGHNMTIDQLQEIVRAHALPFDQLQGIFPRMLKAEHDLADEEQKLGRVQRRNKNAQQKSSSSSSSSGDGGSSSSADDLPLSTFLPIWVNNTNDFVSNCPMKGSANTLCAVTFFADDVQTGLMDKTEKCDELAKGIKKIQSRNRQGYTSVRLLIFETSKYMNFANFLKAGDGMFPSVVFVNPVKGTFHNHIGSFTGSAMSEFMLGRAKTIKAKVYSKDKLVSDVFPDATAANKNKKQQQKVDDDGDDYTKKKSTNSQQEDPEAAARRKKKNDEERKRREKRAEERRCKQAEEEERKAREAEEERKAEMEEEIEAE